jgi:hypothetical protein
MANKERGEISIGVEGKAYTLRPTFNAVCELEQLAGGGFDEVLQKVAQGWMSGMRSTVWCLLQANHSDEITTLADAGNWIERAGTEHILAALSGVLEVNEEPAPSVKGRTVNPRKARAGTGANSSSAPDASA